MLRLLKIILLATSMFALGSEAVHAGGKVALLIGNSAYPGAPHQAGVWDVLPNAAHDVRLVGDALRADGFLVETLPPNAKHDDMSAAVNRFAERAGEADLAVLYYAGHGFEYDRHNYLVPVDAPVSADERDLAKRFIEFDGVVNAVAQAKMSVFFLDACRTAVPFVKVTPRDARALLGANKFDDVQRPEGAELAVLYSAARGKPALDVAAPPPDYSPFAWAVAQTIKTPNISVQDVFATVTGDVRDRTRSISSQVPYTDGALFPGHYFTTADTSAVAGPRPGASSRPPPANRLSLDPRMLAVTDEPVVVVRVLRAHSWQEIQALANAGDTMANYIFGYMNEFGEGVPENLELARQWLKTAADAHTPWGELEYGYFLYENGSTPTERSSGIDQMRLAAAQDYPKAKAHLARVLMAEAGKPAYGNDAAVNAQIYQSVTADYQTALDLYAAAANGGYPEAMEALVLRGDPAIRPVWRARLRALADGGDPVGNEWLCEIEAKEGDHSRAFADCTVAAEAGYAVGVGYLAVAFHEGFGAAKSDEDAQHWTKIALTARDLPESLRTTLNGYHSK